MRGKTRVNIGSAFERWQRLMQLYPELKRDEIVAEFLLDRYFKLPSLSYHVSGEEGCVSSGREKRVGLWREVELFMFKELCDVP